MTESLHLRVARRAAGWLERAGAAPQMFGRLRQTDYVFWSKEPAERALLAAAAELVDLLAESPEGRQALADLRFEPFLQQVERPGG